MNVSTLKSRQAELAALYDSYYDKILRYAFSHIGNRTEAEDIAGEVFMKALDSLQSYQERGIPMHAWLFRIAHNLVVDYFRETTKKRSLPLDIALVSTPEDPVASAERNLEMENVNRAMKELTPEQQEVLRLRFFGGLSSKEVAVLVNKKDGAVREMQSAALEKLRRLLGEC
jgi:RNA polymerase sigma-70 factor, ECF subfamily